MCPTRPYNTKLVFKGFFKYTQAMQSDVLQIHLHAYSGAIEEYLGQYISTWWGFSPFLLTNTWTCVFSFWLVLATLLMAIYGMRKSQIYWWYSKTSVIAKCCISYKDNEELFSLKFLIFLLVFPKMLITR